MNVNEVIAALAAGIVAGIALAFLERTFPTSGIRRL